MERPPIQPSNLIKALERRTAEVLERVKPEYASIYITAQEAHAIVALLKEKEPVHDA